MSLSLTAPAWLWLLVPAALWLLLMERRSRAGSAWQDLVDGHLLEHLLVHPKHRQRRATVLALAAMAMACAVLALAGPVIQGPPRDYALTTPLLLAAALIAALGFRRGWLR